MLYKRVHLRTHLASETAAAAERFSLPAHERLEELLTPYLEAGEALPDIALLQQLVGRLLADRGAALTRRTEELQLSETEARQLRFRRDDAAEELRETLRGARFYFDQTEGRGAGARRGIGHGLTRMPLIFLVRAGEAIAEELAAPAPAPRRPSFGGVPDRQELAEAVRQRTAALKSLVDQLRPQRSGCITARGEKERSLAATEAIVRASAGFLAGLYKLCDLKYLAKKVRPAFRRTPRRRAGEIETITRLEDRETVAAPPAAGPVPVAAEPPTEKLERAAPQRQPQPSRDRPEQLRDPLRGPWGLRKGGAPPKAARRSAARVPLRPFAPT